MSRWHLVEHFASILNAPTVCIHVQQATPHKDTWIPSTYSDLLMNTPALFKGKFVSIQQPHESTESGCMPSCCICQNSMPSKLPHGSHSLHTCPPSYSPQGHQTCTVHFGRAVHKQACCLQVFLNSTCLKSPEQKWMGQDSFLLVAFSGCYYIFCKLLIPCQIVQFHGACCHCSHLCCCQ